jgi:hypothetical protein
MHRTPASDEPKAYSIRKFRATMAARIDQGEIVPVMRNNKRVGWYVPDGKPFPVPEDEIEPEDEFERLPDDDGPIVLTTVTASDGPRWRTLWTSSRLTLPEMFDSD